MEDFAIVNNALLAIIAAALLVLVAQFEKLQKHLIDTDVEPHGLRVNIARILALAVTLLIVLRLAELCIQYLKFQGS